MHTTDAPVSLARGLFLALAMMALAALSFYLLRPPAARPYDAPEDLFSAERAARHLEAIAAESHPMGSPANERVRDYLMLELEALGLAPVLHETEYFDPVSQHAARLGNVLARIPGTEGGRAILLMAHYDSREGSYGAADNGSSVAAILEFLRLLGHRPPLASDLIVLFSDGEEYGLLGARAFVEEHPWAGEVAMVFNLEARGTKGASILFETGEGNRRMVRAFARGSRKPLGTSLGYEIYSRMPNDTDFSPFKQRGYAGLNIAYLDNPFDYHTAADHLDNLSLRSLQHQGSYLESLVPYLGDSELDLQDERNAVFFNTLGFHVAHYPFSRALPLAVAALLLFVLLLLPALHRGHLRLLKALYGLLAFVLYLFLVYVLFGALYGILSGYYPGTDHILLDYHHHQLFAAFTALWLVFTLLFFRACLRGVRWWEALLLLLGGGLLLWWAGRIDLLHGGGLLVSVLVLYLMARRPLSSAALWTGAQFLWLVLVWVTALAFPGVSYLLLWPLVFSLAGALLLLLLPAGPPARRTRLLVLLAAALPALAWLPYISYTFTLAMGLGMIAIALILPALMAGLLVPQLEVVVCGRGWLVTLLVFFAGCFLLYQGAVRPDYDARHQQPNSIRLACDGTEGRSWWMAPEEHHDAWTEQFLTDRPDTLPLEPFFPYTAETMLARETHIPGPALPYALLLSDTLAGAERRLGMQLFSPGGQRLEVYIRAGESPVSIRLNGAGPWPLRAIGQDAWHYLRYFNMAEDGIHLEVVAGAAAAVELQLTDIVTGFPAWANKEPRPPAMRHHVDRTLAGMRYVFPVPSVVP
jgi:hypothetical protein